MYRRVRVKETRRETLFAELDSEYVLLRSSVFPYTGKYISQCAESSLTSCLKTIIKASLRGIGIAVSLDINFIKKNSLFFTLTSNKFQVFAKAIVRLNPDTNAKVYLYHTPFQCGSEFFRLIKVYYTEHCLLFSFVILLMLSLLRCIICVFS
jgi:hypothetical protein